MHVLCLEVLDESLSEKLLLMDTVLLLSCLKKLYFWWDEKRIQNFSRAICKEKPLALHRRMWEGIIKVYLKQITCESVELIRVAWDRATGKNL